jgi:hypothetical protein
MAGSSSLLSFFIHHQTVTEQGIHKTQSLKKPWWFASLQTYNKDHCGKRF